MNLFNALKSSLEELENDDLNVFYRALYSKKDEPYISEIVDLCENNYFYVHFVKSGSDNKYDVGEIIVSFDDETRYHECTYHFHLTYVSQDSYLPKVTIQKKQFLNSFIHINKLDIK